MQIRLNIYRLMLCHHQIIDNTYCCNEMSSSPSADAVGSPRLTFVQASHLDILEYLWNKEPNLLGR